MDIIDQFFDKKLITSIATKRNYRMNIQNYFKLLNKPIDTYFQNGYKLEDYDEHLRTIYKLQQENGRPDLSMRTFFNAVKQFMTTNNKQLKDLEFWDILKARTRGAEPSSDEAILNSQDIKEILSHGNACSRALFLMLASSGRRISEILALTPEDIDTAVSPTTIKITKGLESKQTKTKQKTMGYISDEATLYYNAWMKERDEYLKSSMGRKYNAKNKEPDNRIFPMCYVNALVMWRTLLMRAQLVEIERVKDKNGLPVKRIKRKKKGARTLQHPHCLRKFYRSYLGDADFAEYMMGHSTMLTRAYRQMKPEDLAEKYRKVMPNVTIFETQVDLTGINKSLDVKDKQIKELQEKIARYDNDKIKEYDSQILERENELLKKKYDQQAKEIKEIKTILNDYILKQS